MPSKIINLTLALMFLAFAIVQINDPDPIHWVLIYGAMVAVCAMAAFQFYHRITIKFLLVGYLAYSFMFWYGIKEWLIKPNKSLLFDDLAKMQYPYIEESREFLGLMICIAVLAIYLMLSYKKVEKK